MVVNDTIIAAELLLAELQSHIVSVNDARYKQGMQSRSGLEMWYSLSRRAAWRFAQQLQQQNNERWNPKVTKCAFYHVWRNRTI